VTDSGFVVGDRVKSAGYGHIGTVVEPAKRVDTDYVDKVVWVLFDVDQADPWPCPPHMLTKLGIVDRLASIADPKEGRTSA
jgi:hypothetical protein